LAAASLPNSLIGAAGVAEAVAAYQALRTLATLPGFMRVERQRVGDLIPS
jgi:hypothetical protein